MMEVIEHYAKIHRLIDLLQKPFLKFKVYREAREPYGFGIQRECYFCNKKFKDEDDTYLGTFDNGAGNKLLCKDCWEKAKESL